MIYNPSCPIRDPCMERKNLQELKCVRGVKVLNSYVKKHNSSNKIALFIPIQLSIDSLKNDYGRLLTGLMKVLLSTALS
jgi:hypothetical protein